MFNLVINILVGIFLICLLIVSYKCWEAYEKLEDHRDDLIKQLLVEYDRGYSAGSREGANKGYSDGWYARGVADASQELHGL